MARPSQGERQRERVAQLQIIRRFEARLGKAVGKALKSAGAELASHYKSTGKVPAHLPKSSRKALEKALRTILLKAGTTMGNRAVALWKARNPFEAAFKAWLNAHVGEAITSLDATMIAAVRDVVLTGTENADAVSDIATAIRERLGGDIGRRAAEKIARTEVHTASSVAQQQAAEDSQVDLVKTWCSAQDERTRETHADADGQTRDLDEAFSIGTASMMHPGEGPPEETINCRCCVLYTPRQ